MQKSTMATVAIATLAVFSVFIVTEWTDTGAETVTSSSNVVEYSAAVSNSRELSIIINESYFKAVDGNYSTQWSYAIGDPSSSLTYYPFNLGSTVNNTNFDFTVSQKVQPDSGGNRADLVGQYSLTVDAKVRAETTLVLKFVIDYEVDVEGDINDRDMLTEPLYLVYNLALKEYQVLPNYIEYGLEGSSGSPYVSLREGEPITLYPTIKKDGVDLDRNNYNWYALDLPKGMAMTSSGLIAGVPVEVSVTGGVKATIFVQDKYNQSAKLEVMFYVMANSSSGLVTYYLKNGDVSSGESTTGMIYEPSVFYTQRDRVASLSILDVEDNKYAVEVMSDTVLADSSTNRVFIDPVNYSPITLYDGDEVQRKANVYHLSTGGTGIYKVNIYSVDENNNKSLVDSFDLYVLSKVLAVESAIIVGSDGSSS